MLGIMNRMDGGQTQVEHDGSDLTISIIKEHNQRVALGKRLIEKGEPALYRLMAIVERHDGTGQARYIACFLLALYNGPRFPFCLTDLRSLDTAIMDDCLAVLEMDMKACKQEVHRYFNNGGERFERFFQHYNVEESYAYR